VNNIYNLTNLTTMTRLNQKNMIEAIQGSGGNQTIIAKKCGVTRAAVSIYLKKNQKINELVNQEREKLVDKAENVNVVILNMKGTVEEEKTISPKILALKQKVAEFLLKTQGKARGYTEKQELEHSGQGQQIIFQEIIRSNEEIKELKNDKTNNTKPETA